MLGSLSTPGAADLQPHLMDPADLRGRIDNKFIVLKV